MNRRKFIALIILGGIGIMALIVSSFLSKRKIKSFMKNSVNKFKPTVNLPEEGKTISLETALNSRCTSDYDNNPENFHWGMFNKSKKLSSEQIENVLSLARIPRFTDHKITIQPENNILTFVVQRDVSGIIRDWIMVESGMMQQAVGLVCAAMGVGMVFRNIGKDGKPISDTDYGTIRMKLGPMKPAYNGAFWSSQPPSGAAPRQKKNLSDPDRDGGKPLLSTLLNLKIENKGSSAANEKSISQLLWAARGRTPHLYKSTPWGMTIPTWAGKQNISGIYLVSQDKLYRYVNWEDNKPTHSLQQLDIVDEKLLSELHRLFFLNHGLIILGKNEEYSRAFWEVGYQLLNLLLQATSLDISYQAILLNKSQKSFVSQLDVGDPVAIFAI